MMTYSMVRKAFDDCYLTTPSGRSLIGPQTHSDLSRAASPAAGSRAPKSPDQHLRLSPGSYKQKTRTESAEKLWQLLQDANLISTLKNWVSHR